MTMTRAQQLNGMIQPHFKRMSNTWSYRARVIKTSSTCICVECGNEFPVQRKAAMYECERCVNLREGY